MLSIFQTAHAQVHPPLPHLVDPAMWHFDLEVLLTQIVIIMINSITIQKVFKIYENRN